MNKVLSKKEKKRRMLKKIFISMENKLSGENLIWWNSISMKARYSFIFSWLRFKRVKSDFKFKHFVKSHKKLYKATKLGLRNAKIEQLINE
jgi:hypothetical protein